MQSTEKLDTHRKALTLNLDPSTFGSFAEIGAGQEVARWFLAVGGASGTVAKSISAYDKEVSDSLYGSGSRYVSRQRLERMLGTEWSQLLNQLDKTRGSQTRFFSFVDTVCARNYAGTNDSHGWVGLRFQSNPSGQPSDIFLHINMKDSSNILQQEAIGILGVNLIYAAFYQLQTKESFFEGLAQDVVRERIEIDFVDFHRPAFASWDRQTVLAYLVHGGLGRVLSSFGRRRSCQRISAQESSFTRTWILRPCGPCSRANSCSNVGDRRSRAITSTPTFWKVIFSFRYAFRQKPLEVGHV